MVNYRQMATSLQAEVLVVAHNPSSALIAAQSAHISGQLNGNDYSPRVSVLTTKTIEWEATTYSKESSVISDLDYENAIGKCSESPIVHVVMDGPCGPLWKKDSEIPGQIRFMGMQPYRFGGQQARGQSEQVPSELAQELGLVLQNMMDLRTNECAVSMDWPWHLAMLQRNSLPKPYDTYLVLPSTSIPSLVLVQYLYDYSRLGGTDPLSCSTSEQSLQSTCTPVTDSFAVASGTAYTTMRGLGMTPSQASLKSMNVASYICGLGPSPDKAPEAQIDYTPTVRRQYRAFGYC